MELSRMSSGIIKMINLKYNKIIDDDCLDIMQIKNICSLIKTKQTISTNKSISLSEINICSPDFKKMNTKINKKKQNDILKSTEFTKKYSFFIRILYSCLKIEIEIFNTDNNIITLKNNYQLIKSLELHKKYLINEHTSILKSQYKNITHPIDSQYENYCKGFITKIKIIDKVMLYINRLVDNDIFGKTDNLLSLILPYFYTYTEFIEEYS